MKLTARGVPSAPRMVMNNLSKMEALIVLGAFENELDSLAALAAEGGGGTVAEAVIRRYQSAEQLLSELEDAHDRIRLKMHVVRERVIGGVSAGNLLEGTGE